MFVLMAYRKDDTTRVIAVNQNRNVLSKLADELKFVANIKDSSEGIWDRKEIKGRVWIEEIEDNGYQRGVDFFLYKK